MSTHRLAVSFILSGLVAWLPYVATAADAPATEEWTPTSKTAQSITGRVTFAPDQLTFQNGKSLPLTSSGEMLFKADPKGKRVTARLYRVTQSDDPTLENGNRLCGGKTVTYVLVWKSPRIGGGGGDPRTMDLFSGKNFTSGSPDDCGRYLYDAAAH